MHARLVELGVVSLEGRVVGVARKFFAAAVDMARLGVALTIPYQGVRELMSVKAPSLGPGMRRRHSVHRRTTRRDVAEDDERRMDHTEKAHA